MRSSTSSARRSLQIVVGASGAGKSSFVHAGVRARAAVELAHGGADRHGADRGARIATRRRGLRGPGRRRLLDSDPTSAVAAVVRHAPDGIVVIVDQLEELFTCCTDHGERERFAAALAAFAGAATPTSARE